MQAERLLSLKANKKMVEDKLEQMSGKIVTLKDINKARSCIKILGMT